MKITLATLLLLLMSSCGGGSTDNASISLADGSLIDVDYLFNGASLERDESAWVCTGNNGGSYALGIYTNGRGRSENATVALDFSWSFADLNERENARLGDIELDYDFGGFSIIDELSYDIVTDTIYYREFSLNLVIRAVCYRYTR